METNNSETEVMEKVVVVKEDGRQLIYYRFRPRTAEGRSPQQESEIQS